MDDFLFGEKEICNYIEDISCVRLSHSTFYYLTKENPLPYVKCNMKNVTTTKKFVKAWLSSILIKSFFVADYKSLGYRFLFGAKKQETCPIIVMTILQTIWIDD